MKTTLLILFISGMIYGQIKIGELTVADSIAEKYLLYCYSTPDTTWFFKYYTSKKETEKAEIELAKKLSKAKTSKDSLEIRLDNFGLSIGRMVDNKESYLSDRNIGRIEKSEVVDDDITNFYVGYLTKREPTGRDYLEWYIKKRGLK